MCKSLAIMLLFLFFTNFNKGKKQWLITDIKWLVALSSICVMVVIYCACYTLFFRHPKTGIYCGEGSERTLLFLPMYHLYGLAMLLLSMFKGYTIISMPKYEMNTLVTHIKTYQVNVKLQASLKSVASPYVG